jgi:hypothetical protein
VSLRTQIEMCKKELESETAQDRYTENFFWRCLDVLEERKSSRTAKINYFVALLHPIRTLPWELLSKILNMVCHAEVEQVGPCVQALRLRRVCRAWRDHIEADPSLWSKIRLDVSKVYRLPDQIELLKLSTVFSRNHKLEIHISDFRETEHMPEDAFRLMRLLATVFYRCRSLSLQNCEFLNIDHPMSSLGHALRLSALEHIEITHTDIHNHVDDAALQNLCYSSPNLHSLKVCLLRNDMRPWPSTIQSVEVGMYGRAYTSLLPVCPGAKVMTIVYDQFPWTNVPFPNIVHDGLEDIILASFDLSKFDPKEIIDTGTNVPRLRRLSLKSTSDPTRSSNCHREWHEGVIRLSNRLTHLQLHNIYVEGERVVDILTQLPSLHAFLFEACNINGLEGVKMLDYTGLCSALTVDYAHKSRNICPRLCELHLDLLAQSFDSPTLVNAVRSRTRQTEPQGLAELGTCRLQKIMIRVSGGDEGFSIRESLLYLAGSCQVDITQGTKHCIVPEFGWGDLEDIDPWD